MHAVARTRRKSKSRWAPAVVVLIFAFFARLAVLVAMPAGLSVDTDGYRRIAVTLRTTGTYGFPEDPETGFADANHSNAARPTAYRPPLYPCLLSIFVREGQLSPFAVGAFHIALGCGTVAIVLWLGRAWGLGRWSLVAAIGTAVDPILLYQSTQIMTETLAAFCAVAALASLTKLAVVTTSHEKTSGAAKHVVLFIGISVGLVLGLACLCRPTFLPWCGLIALSLLLGGLERNRWVAAVSLSCGISAVLLPWGLRNFREFGHFKVSTTHGGYTLLLGNNPSFYRSLREAPQGAVWKSDELDVEWNARTKTEEFGDDKLAYRWASDSIRAEPQMFLWSCCVRVARLWHVLPHRLSDPEPRAKTFLRIAIAGWYCMIYGLSLFAIVRCPSRVFDSTWRWGFLLCATFTVVHALYWSDMRMRAPLMPFIYLVAAASGLVPRSGSSISR